ncbi:RNA-binding cell elongation regulator Jag/EloR [Peptoniphilus obesi]|uniref:RNA-binding cell elongation regulator Jag/EloR n=1 Tax=Peptoniphilus obesi TaxID=1472765 RepID=UPI0004B04576|nr:RNA-binding cell elongation regulator Jag/EloR [Peptoniphilus obesi]
MSYVIKRAKTVDEAVREALKELNLEKDQVKIEVIEEPSKGFLGLIGSKEATVKVSKKEDTSEILRQILDDSYTEKSQEIPVRETELENKENYIDNTSESVEFFEEKIEIEEEIIEESSNKNSEEIDQRIDEIIHEFLGKILDELDIEYDLVIEKVENQINIEIKGDEKKLGIVIGKRGVTLDSIQYILSLLINKVSDSYIRVLLDSSNYRQRRRETLKELAEKMAAKVLSTNRSIRLEPMSALDRKIIHEALQDYKGVITHSEGRDPYRKVVIQKERKY